jgi:hypothetical protein
MKQNIPIYFGILSQHLLEGLSKPSYRIADPQGILNIKQIRTSQTSLMQQTGGFKQTDVDLCQMEPQHKHSQSVIKLQTNWEWQNIAVQTNKVVPSSLVLQTASSKTPHDTARVQEALKCVVRSHLLYCTAWVSFHGRITTRRSPPRRYYHSLQCFQCDIFKNYANS